MKKWSVVVLMGIKGKKGIWKKGEVEGKGSEKNMQERGKGQSYFRSYWLGIEQETPSHCDTLVPVLVCQIFVLVTLVHLGQGSVPLISLYLTPHFSFILIFYVREDRKEVCSLRKRSRTIEECAIFNSLR